MNAPNYNRYDLANNFVPVGADESNQEIFPGSYGSTGRYLGSNQYQNHMLSKATDLGGASRSLYLEENKAR